METGFQKIKKMGKATRVSFLTQHNIERDSKRERVAVCFSGFKVLSKGFSYYSWGNWAKGEVSQIFFYFFIFGVSWGNL